jgi:hypothetical protein
LREDCSSHCFDKAAANRESEARSCLATVDTTPTVKLLEYAFKVCRPYAYSFVCDGDEKILAVASRIHRGRPSAIFVRVVEQIEQNLAQESYVAPNERKVPRQANGRFKLRENFAASL